MNHRVEVTDEDVHHALAHLVAIEQDREKFGSATAYRTAVATHAESTQAAMSLLRTYAEQMQPADLNTMQIHYIGFSNDPRYIGDDVTSMGVVARVLSKAWNGIGPWSR